MSDNLVIFGHTYNNVAGFKATDTNNVVQTFLKAVLGTKSISTNGTYNASSDSLDGFSQVTVNVPTGTARTSADLSASGATVTVPAGLYSSQAQKSVASGTEGTPSATKGAVSNHSILVTPSVTNVAGYIAGGTHTGTGVSVSASELVSGSETKTENGTYDVTNLAELIVSVGGGSFKYEKGSFTLPSNVTSGFPYAISHNLGVAPSLVIIVPSGTITSTSANRGYIWMDKPMGEGTQYLSSSQSSSYPVQGWYNVSDYNSPIKSRINVNTSPSYMIGSGSVPTSSYFYLMKYASSTTWYAGTYKYFISEAFW